MFVNIVCFVCFFVLLLALISIVFFPGRYLLILFVCFFVCLFGLSNGDEELRRFVSFIFGELVERFLRKYLGHLHINCFCCFSSLF